ncbi:Pescadillo N-terminus-domain-containing protein [Protomyces lactucae-debilis]|uniref:Pescadillo homolog n=1 Tax=Protomyces lactucae-debilis TaxID=2754530 RepID=A0A1Y2FWV5_PROLT|nr:Pescadillo N-terminus-domain-containing protein [Protomyces lactucae-debilis]ORY87784.1 Pescadillo N-terminus-domain-containing protein [Protomyces lactucae-debilis]
MAKIKRKGESGAAKNFISRNMALKKLQVTLADFRRLCILKGIYPREPRHKKRANKGSTAPTTFYYTKDISYLLHEPVLNKFREHKIFARKLSKAIGKQQYGTAKRLEQSKPTYTLDHIIKERYPTFIDALRDLDDGLSMLFLFASMPSSDQVNATVIENCDRLCREFEAYVVRAKALRKVFLSIKGIYYQAEIKGQDITWLVPFKFSQHVPTDVDFRIMLTFLEFYQTFVGFVNYRLFTELGLVYPPRLNMDKENSAGGLAALELEQIGLASQDDATSPAPKVAGDRLTTLNIKSIASKQAADTEPMDGVMNDARDLANVNDADIDDFAATTGVTSDLPNAQPTLSASTNLFSDFTFFLAREVPRYSLEFVIKAFGGKVAWDPILGAGSPLQEADSTITHHVCDRPKQERKYQGRSYVQPQWIYDCINRAQLQSVDAYSPGAVLPPHLSPFAKLDEKAYNPEEALDENALADEETLEDDPDADQEETPEVAELDAVDAQRELEAEAAGVSYSDFNKTNPPKTTKKAALTPAEKSDLEGKELARMMMSNKQKKLYAKMKYSNEKKEQEVNTLRRKRQDIAREARSKKPKQA